MDFAASTTEAITSSIAAIAAPFFANLPLILGAVVSITIILWAIRWVLSHFKGGKH